MGGVISPSREIGQRVSLTFLRLLKTIYFYAKNVVGVTTRHREYCKKPRKNADYSSMRGGIRPPFQQWCIRRANDPSEKKEGFLGLKSPQLERRISREAAGVF